MVHTGSLDLLSSLAERLGARFEREYDNIHMGRDFLYRHPGPDEDGAVEAYA